MFGLIRRISNSVVPRPDRPWADDATSNAPKIGRKRRLSSTERDLEEDTEAQSKTKRSRGDTPQDSLPLTTSTSTSEETGSTLQIDSEGVKEVTQGVKEVELEENTEEAATDDPLKAETVVAPELIPLPKEEESGELDETSSIASSGAADEEEGEEQTGVASVETEEAEAATDNEPSPEPVAKSSTDEEPNKDEPSV
ncbi:hypothetical protein BDP27DRAFT_1378984 [Rhodocollybia butyracea]|uniref:Uncharacterized protein n=1 Tax=Rhodocollybia butyracea TaxID=206335 RepID=A0A9P5QB34_9AGAR|nr:hypothetical protein BDP27DRAFT_1378984 [Rhodocollybia butyracea]